MTAAGRSAKWMEHLTESSEARLPANGSLSGSVAVDDIPVKLRSCANPGESCSKELTNPEFDCKRRSYDQISEGAGSKKVASSFELTLKTTFEDNKVAAHIGAFLGTEKRPDASHISASPERETSEQRLLPVAEGFTTINFANLQAQSVKVKNWACVNFSSISGKDLLRFLCKLGKMCRAIGMDFSPEPTILIHKNSYKSTDIGHCLWSVHKFYDNHDMEKDQARFLLVILPDARISDVEVEEGCELVGAGYQCCLPLDARTFDKKYLKSVANEIKTKVLGCNTLSDSSEDMSEDEDSDLGSDKESGDDGSGSEETGTGHGIESCKDMSEDGNVLCGLDKESGEDDGCEQSDDSKKEMRSVLPYSSHNDMGEDGISEMSAGSNEENEDDSCSDDETTYLGKFLETRRFLPVGKRKCVDRGDLPVEGGKVKIWACVSFSRMFHSKTYRFIQKLKHACMSIGMDFSLKPSAFLDEVSTHCTSIQDTLWQVHDWISKPTRNGKDRDQIDLLFVILPDKRDYDDKVEEVCKNMGVVYQCCSPKFVRKPSKNYLLEAAIEIKSKVVGHRTGPLRKAIPFVSEATVIFGADILHCAPAEGSISIASVVASMNWPEVSRYRSVVNGQPYSEVVIKDLFTINGGMIRELLFAFQENTKQRAQKIIFFRHGIVESQLSHIVGCERDAIRKACASVEEGYEPPITYVVVAIKHDKLQSSLSLGRSEMTNKSENSLRGTEVGEDGSNPTKFFFCNHAALEGTSMLAHYRVIHDDNHFTIDEVKFLCDNLCTPHDRWACPEMSMVPPAFFASRVASLASSHVEEQRSLGLACDDPATLGLPKYLID